MPPRRPVIASVLMVRDEFPLIVDTVGHHLFGLGVDRVIVGDNDSSDLTRPALEEIARRDPRVEIRDIPGGYRQAEVMTELFREASADAEWVLPADADEFVSLRDIGLHELCAGTAAAALSMGVVNMVQRRTVRRERPGSIESMTRRARPHGNIFEAEELVTSGCIPFLQMAYPPKLLVRADVTVRLTQGQHGAEGLSGEIVPTDRAQVLHVPIRSRDDLETRVLHAQRIGDDPSRSWHLRRMRHFGAEELDREWRINSFAPGLPSARWRSDLRLRTIGRSQRAFRAEILETLGVSARRLPRGIG